MSENENTNPIGKIESQSISSEMKESYLDYAMSVIISRALPDVRDGMKPVHRRILYAMWTLGLKSDAKFRKSATVVGEVIGKYHPHGDSAIYESMVRMAQDFSMRYMLVNGQGNFGSIDGDPAAAMRYTEAKMQKISEEILYDLEKNTVDFRPNYDDSQKEPSVLPAKVPNLLMNGVMGIAVGMATNIPPHNLHEIIGALNYLIDHPEAQVEELTEFIQGPDFPTGGIIYDKKDIREAYATGRGRVVMRAKTEIEEPKAGQFQIIVNEIPYQVNKANLIEKIAELVKDKKIEGIKELRDESNKEGIRILIGLKRDANPKKLLNKLFKLTSLQDTFNFNMVALIDGVQPRVMTLKMILEEYLKHRQKVIKRRTEFDLEKARDRAHILEGLKMALDKIDAVIDTIRKSKDREEAKTNLITKFKLSEKQSVAILEMRLQSLASLERLKIEGELKEKIELIKELEDILSSKERILQIIKDELNELDKNFGDSRKTKIIDAPVGEFKQEDMIADEPAVVSITKSGYIKRLSPDNFKAQTRGGKGIIGLITKEEDAVNHFFSTTTHTDILFFTTAGYVFRIKGYDIPEGSRVSRGQSIANLLELKPNERISAILPLDEINDYKYLVMATHKGLIKKVKLEDFAVVRRSGLIAIKLRPEDSLGWVKPSGGEDNIIVATSLGQSIMFNEKDVRHMGRNASGVTAARLKKDDEVIGMDVIENDLNLPLDVLVVMKNGYGKRTSLKEYRAQSRAGSGVKTANITTKTGNIVAMRLINSKTDEDMIVISDKGQVIRLPLAQVRTIGRSTQGVCIMKFKNAGDKIASVAFV